MSFNFAHHLSLKFQCDISVNEYQDRNLQGDQVIPLLKFLIYLPCFEMD